jgi:hypothetical protein
MSRESRESRTPRHVRERGGATGTPTPNGEPITGGTVHGASGGDDNRKAACASLSYLFLRDDGWLRASPKDGKTLYLKWKFTNGRWAQHYVMVVVDLWLWDWGVQLLEDKLNAVDAGIFRPSKDTWYNPDDGAPAD